jgi:prevent-host-death family protein
MARAIRKPGVKQVPLSEIKDDLSRYLREAETQEIVITRHGKPAGVLIGFESEEDWLEYPLKTIHDFCAGSSSRATVCMQGAVSVWKTSKRNSDARATVGARR